MVYSCGSPGHIFGSRLLYLASRVQHNRGFAGQDYKEDCVEIAVPGLQSSAHACSQGTPALPVQMLLKNGSVEQA